MEYALEPLLPLMKRNAPLVTETETVLAELSPEKTNLSKVTLEFGPRTSLVSSTNLICARPVEFATSRSFLKTGAEVMSTLLPDAPTDETRSLESTVTPICCAARAGCTAAKAKTNPIAKARCIVLCPANAEFF